MDTLDNITTSLLHIHQTTNPSNPQVQQLVQESHQHPQQLLTLNQLQPQSRQQQQQQQQQSKGISRLISSVDLFHPIETFYPFSSSLL